MQNYTIADTTAPLSFFAKNGYYIVGNKIFNHKIYALQEATRTGQKIKWNFNEDVFGKIDWKQRINVPLRELYRMRAQQLRNRYKYIICAWSGGGDSTTMCEAFLENGIHLDEILTLWPLSLSEGKYTPNSKDTSNVNMPSEFDFSVRPRIEMWKQQYPNQKITVADTCDILKNEYFDDTVRICEKHSYLGIQRWRHQDKILQERIDQYGDSICIVHGISPVEVVLLDDYVAVKFVDNLAGAGVKSDYTLTGIPRNLEYFYWSGDLPEIMVRQAHDVYDSIKLDQNNRRYFHQMCMQPDGTLKLIHTPDYELNRRFKKKIVYPDYPWDWFQVGKQTRTHDSGPWESWFETNPHSKEFTIAHTSAITAHTNLIDNKFKVFYQGLLSNYIPYQTPFYVAGKLPGVDMSKVFSQKTPDQPGFNKNTTILSPYSLGL
jgi:hypothetical protein